MARNFVKFLVAASILFAVSGCGKQNSGPTIDDFNGFASQYAATFRELTTLALPADKPGRIEVMVVSTDSVKTDSVAHPIVFQLIFHVTLIRNADSMVLSESEIRTQFIHDHGSWEPINQYHKVIVDAGNPNVTGVEQGDTMDDTTRMLARKAQGLPLSGG